MLAPGDDPAAMGGFATLDALTTSLGLGIVGGPENASGGPDGGPVGGPSPENVASINIWEGLGTTGGAVEDGQVTDVTIDGVNVTEQF